MQDQQLKALQAPFPQGEVKQREGNFGRTLDYLDAYTVINRLNEAFMGNWNFFVEKYEIHEDLSEVVVLGRLVAGDVTKMQAGGARLKRHINSGELIGLSDDVKAAISDALKKCASLLGLGLYLYRDNRQDCSKNEQSVSANDTRNNHSPRKAGAGANRISSKQHSFLQSLLRERSMTRKEVDELCVKRFGVVMDHLSRSDASTLIEGLKAEKPLIAAS